VRARLTGIAVGVGLAIVAIAVARFARDHWGGVYDDAFIYLRYVKNLDAGCGLRFNCGDPPVEGFTGPLYLAMLWLGGRLTTQLIDLAQIVCTASLAVALALAVWAAAVAGRGAAQPRLPAVLAVAVAAALALDPFVLLNAITGMETALAAAAVTAIALAALAGRRWLLVAAIGGALLVRPEALVFAAALPLLPALRRPRYLAALAAIVAAICAARYAAFGALLPNTYYAKAGGTWRHCELGLAYLADAIADFPLAFAAPLALLLPAGPRRRACGFVLAGAAAWVAFFLRSGGDLFEYSRMVFPLVPALYVLALAGIAELAQRIAERTRARPALAGALAAAACALAAGGRAAVAHAIPPQGASPRVVEWAAVGRYLHDHFRGATVATVPIGAIGYYSRLPIIDLVGLTEPAIARAGRTVPPELLTRRWIGHERHCTECVLARAPALIVTTMSRDRPWQTLADARAGFYADWLLLQEIKAGRAPYRVRDAEVLPGDHILMFERIPDR
jgi:arabinofuranosyltransferase